MPSVTQRVIRSAGVAGALGALLVSCAIPPAPLPLEPQTVVIEQTPGQSQRVIEPEVRESEPVDPVTERIEDTIAVLELREKLAGLMVVTIAGMDPALHRAFRERVPSAGFLLLRDNLQGDPAGISAFVEGIQQGVQFPLLIAVDQEGSPITRISGDTLPGALELGGGSTDVTQETFALRQEIVSGVGANLNFGVVADVSQGSGAYIHSRSFSTSADTVADHVAAAIAGGKVGVAQTLKHFPGHGMVFVDTHTELPSVPLSYDQWRAAHAEPFIAGIAAGVELVMMAHIRVSTISEDPASLSNEWVGILRNDLGFEGVIITDDLWMLRASGEDAYQDPAATMVAALVAGNDLLLLALSAENDPTYATYERALDALVEAVRSGQVSIEQVDASLERVLRLRASLG